MMEENQEKSHQIASPRLITRYHPMTVVKDNQINAFVAKITFRFGLFSSIESTNSGLCSIYWHGERNFAATARFWLLSFGTWCTIDADDGGHTFRWCSQAEFKGQLNFCFSETFRDENFVTCLCTKLRNRITLAKDACEAESSERTGGEVRFEFRKTVKKFVVSLWSFEAFRKFRDFICWILDLESSTNPKTLWRIFSPKLFLINRLILFAPPTLR